jgi:hypothetical protein
MYKVKSPILFLIFNRPEETLAVFNAIRVAKPSRLYIAQDGPRSKEGEANLCETTRKILLNVDWECELKTLIRSENLGCKIAVSEAITWFFKNEPEGIILEDDCLPSNDFFRFCDENLDRYRFDTRIGHISGSNYQNGNKFTTADSYYFSKLFDVWGWATWKRVWINYDVNMENLQIAIEKDFYKCVTNNANFKDHLYQELIDVKSNKISSWAYPYTFSNTIQGYLSIFPQNNMISNIGCNERGTHTLSTNSFTANLPHAPLPLITIHPTFFIANKFADEFTLAKTAPHKWRKILGLFKQKIVSRLKSILGLKL